MTARQLARALGVAATRVEPKQTRYERAVRVTMRELLLTAARRFEERATVLTADAGDQPPPAWVPPEPDELMSIAEIVAALRGKTDPVRLSAIADFFAEFGDQAEVNGVRARWDVTNPVIAAHLERTGSQVTAVADTTRLNIRGLINRAYSEGLSVPDTAKAIRAAAPGISTARATLIARTEFVGLVQGASLTAVSIVSEATGEGYFKVWRTAPGAEYPRHEDYPELDGQTVPLDGLFVVGDDMLAYPGDPDGEPGEVCNCRCDLEYVERGEDTAEE